MRRYLTRAPKTDYPEGIRIVHNFYPGPPDDPGRDRMVALDGFRIWITDEGDSGPEGGWGGRRCYCGWLNGREHYGTVGVIEAQGERFWLYGNGAEPDDDELGEEVADAMLVLGEMARERGVIRIADLGDLPPLDPETKAKYLARARAREARGS